jgi:hypothetical protein
MGQKAVLDQSLHVRMGVPPRLGSSFGWCRILRRLHVNALSEDDAEFRVLSAELRNRKLLSGIG